jgi:hypothetical protein
MARGLRTRISCADEEDQEEEIFISISSAYPVLIRARSPRIEDPRAILPCHRKK